jgi:peptide/nickel transport system substrate-binding protein
MGGAAWLAGACGDDDDDEDGGNGTPGTGGGADVPDGHQTLGTTTEELRQQFHWSKLKNVPGQGDPKPGGRLVFAGFDPGNWALTDPGAAIMSSFAGHHYNGLITFPISDFDDAHRLEPEGDLAKDWEQPDDTTYIFNLHDGITWQDVPPTNGRAFTAEDAVYGYTVLKEKTSFQAGTYQQVKSFEAPDDKTVIFHMNQPAAYLLNNMMVPVHVVAPRELVEKPDEFSDSAVGTGPFILESWEPGGTWKARKNPNYFRKWNGHQLPFLDGLESRNFIGNDAGRIAAFRSGELDTIWNPDLPNFRTLLQEQPDLIGQIATPPPGAQNYISMHVERPPLNDVRLRQALSLAIDRNLIDQGIFSGLSGPGYSQDWSFFKDAQGGFREWPWDENELGDFHHFDPAEAKKLYEAAGFSQGNPLKMKYNYSASPGPGQDLHLLVLQQWKEHLGVEAEFVGMETIGWIGAHFSRSYDDALGSWYSGPAFDPDGYSYEVLHSKAPGNIYGVNDSEMDALLEAQRRELDYDTREQKLREAMLIDLNQVYRIWTRNQYKQALRKRNYFNVVDTIHAWGNIGWGAKGDEKVWTA